MIRKFETADMNDILDLWLKTSIEAHCFVGKEFWESKIDDMRKLYIPASDTYVFSDNGIIKGFFSLYEDTLAALFVDRECQGKGIGTQLVNNAKSLRRNLNVSVYEENSKSVQFYKKCGFTIIGKRTDTHTGHIELLMEYNTD